jgi:tRNA-specific 2-thiouridylase
VAGVNLIPGEPEEPVTADVKIRYRHPGTEAGIAPLESWHATVMLKEPQAAIAPGQAAVFYRGDMVIGGGWIEEVLR